MVWNDEKLGNVSLNVSAMCRDNLNEKCRVCSSTDSNPTHQSEKFYYEAIKVSLCIRTILEGKFLQ